MCTIGPCRPTTPTATPSPSCAATGGGRRTTPRATCCRTCARGCGCWTSGAGPGTITADLAELVGPGTTSALEHTEDAIALTRAELERRGLAGVTCLVGDVHALDLPDGGFDVVHAHQVLQHVADPVPALRELLRVTADDGLVAVRDSDYSAFTW